MDIQEDSDHPIEHDTVTPGENPSPGEEFFDSEASKKGKTNAVYFGSISGQKP